MPKGKFPYIVGVFFAALVLFIVLFVPDYLSDRKAKQFAEPLYNHEMPADAKLVQCSASQDDAGSSAVLLLQTSWSQDEIYDFYNDITYPPARENDEVTLSVKPLDDSSLEALKQAGKLEDGASYWWVYVYSAPAQ